jgi:hypothetical protein
MKPSFRISELFLALFILLLNIVNNGVVGWKVLTSGRMRYESLCCKFRAEMRLLASTTDSVDPIDPLDESSDLRKAKFQPKRTKNKMLSPSNQENKVEKALQAKSNGYVKQKREKGFKSASNIAVSEDLDNLTIDQRILLSQAEILRTLPLDYFLSFRNICEQLVPRFGIYTLTFHVILLIPIIRIVKFQLNASVYPFLYIGPALFLVPYVFFWLWENDVYAVPIIDTGLQRYLQKQKQSATKILEQERSQLMTAARTSEDDDVIKKLANLSLMSSIDIENLMSEVLAIKKRIKGRSDKNPAFSTYSQDNSIVNEKQVNFSDDVNSVVKSLIENSLLGESDETPQSLLVKLKQLEADLDRSP